MTSITLIVAFDLTEAHQAAKRAHLRNGWYYPGDLFAAPDLVVYVTGWERSSAFTADDLAKVDLAGAAELVMYSSREQAVRASGVALEQRMLKRERDRRRKAVVQISPEQVAATALVIERPRRRWWRRG